MKIKYILSHPIHYQVPLIKYLKKKKINIRLAYRSNLLTNNSYDPGFRKKINFGVNLLKGYEYQFLNYIGPNKVSKLYPLTTNFISKIFDNETNIIWLHGIKNWYNLCIIFLAKFYNKKIFIRDEVFHKSKNRSLFNKYFNYVFYFIIDNFIDVFLSIGKENRKYYLDHNIKKNKIVMVPYTVDNKFFFYKKRKNNKKINFLFAGKLKKRKGVDLIIKAVKILKKKKSFNSYCNFLILGDGYMKKNLKNFVKKYNLNNIKFGSFKNQKQLAKLYKLSDVFIMPSTREPWGLTVNEAMASGNAIIVSDNVGCSYDLVKNGKNGFKFKSGDEFDLSNQIYKIYKKRKYLRKYQVSSLKIISKWNFNACYLGIKKSISLLNISK